MLPAAGPEIGGKVILPGSITIWQRHIYFTAAGAPDIYRTPLVNRMS